MNCALRFSLSHASNLQSWPTACWSDKSYSNSYYEDRPRLTTAMKAATWVSEVRRLRGEGDSILSTWLRSVQMSEQIKQPSSKPPSTLRRNMYVGPSSKPLQDSGETQMLGALPVCNLSIVFLIDCLRELRGWPFSLQNRLREHTLTIVLPTRTTRRSWAIAESMQHNLSLYVVFLYTTCRLRRPRG